MANRESLLPRLTAVRLRSLGQIGAGPARARPGSGRATRRAASRWGLGRGLHNRFAMTKSLISTGAALLLTLTLGACGHSTPPASTTTTKTETATENASGEKTKSEVTEKRVEHSDGTQEVQTSTKTKEVTPPASGK